MNAKKIERVLKCKFDDYLASIDDASVRKLVKENSIITGGAIASMLLNEKVNDFDIYFTNKETVVAVCEYYIQLFYEKIGNDNSIPNNILNIEYNDDRVLIHIKSAGVISIADFDNYDIEECGKYFPVCFTPNAITLSDKIQIIIRFFGSPKEIHKNYDFAHCKCYWTSKNGKLTLPKKALESLLTKELIYTGSKYPLSSIIRARKFIERGFTINAGQYLKMAIQLNDLDLRDLNVLEEQLVGIDAIMFSHMLTYMKENDVFIDGKVDTTSFFDIINKFF